jgi:hypothetical protein
MERLHDYRWSSIFAWGLTLSGAALATGGVVGMFWPAINISALCVIAFAGMMAFGIGLVNCSAAGALHAIKHKKADGRQIDWTVLVPAVATCLGFAFATNLGVHMGWEVVKANAPEGARLPPTATVDMVFYIFAFAKPAMAWIVEGRRAMDDETKSMLTAARKKEAAAMAAAAAEAALAAEARIAARETPKPEKVKRATSIRAAAKRAAADVEPPANRAAVHDIEARRQDPLLPDQIARARELLIKAGKPANVRSVSEILAVSRQRVERSWPKGVPMDGAGDVRAA